MIRRLIPLLLVLVVLVSGLLYRTSYSVQAMEQKLDSMNHEIIAEQENIHVLKAEWSYLNDPARLEALAKKYLALQPVQTAQIIAMNNLPSKLPVHGAPESAPTAQIIASAASAHEAKTAKVAAKDKVLVAMADTPKANSTGSRRTGGHDSVAMLLASFSSDR